MGTGRERKTDIRTKHFKIPHVYTKPSAKACVYMYAHVFMRDTLIFTEKYLAIEPVLVVHKRIYI